MIGTLAALSLDDGTRLLYLALHRLSPYFAAVEKIASGKPPLRISLIRDRGMGINLLTLRKCETAFQEARIARTDVQGGAVVLLRAERAARPGGSVLPGGIAAAIDAGAIGADPANARCRDALVALDLTLRYAPPPHEREAA